MKIVLIQPRSFHTWEALNLGFLASFLKKEGYPDIEFLSGFFDDDETIIERCKSADIIGVSCTSPQFKHGLKLARKVKTDNNYIVFGGFHPSAVPNDVVKYDCIDSVVVGEGEKAFLEIVKGNRKPIVRADYISNLDSIPFPDREIIKQERNLERAKRVHGQRIAGIFSSRGCPFKCLFCASHTVWGRKTRFRSPENIFTEFEYLVKDYKVDFITFADDEIGINKKHLSAFCELKISKGLKTPWGCNVVAKTLNEDMLKTMKAANCTELWIGVESGSPSILKDVKKASNLQQIKDAFKMTKEYGFKRRAYFLLGMPDEDYEDIKKTEDLIEEIRPDIVGFTILAPYPGTACYDPEVHKDVDWSKVDEYENNMTRTKHLSNDDLKSEQKRLVNKYQDMIAFRQKDDTEKIIQQSYLIKKYPGRSGI